MVPIKTGDFCIKSSGLGDLQSIKVIDLIIYQYKNHNISCYDLFLINRFNQMLELKNKALRLTFN